MDRTSAGRHGRDALGLALVALPRRAAPVHAGCAAVGSERNGRMPSFSLIRQRARVRGRRLWHSGAERSAEYAALFRLTRADGF